MVKERTTFCSADLSFSLGWSSHQQKCCEDLSCLIEKELFTSVHWLKHTHSDPLSGVRRESVHGLMSLFSTTM